MEALATSADTQPNSLPNSLPNVIEDTVGGADCPCEEEDDAEMPPLEDID